MKTAKAILCIILSLAISLGLSACSSSAVSAPTMPDAAQAGADLEPAKTAAETEEAAETETPATEQPEAPEPKLCALVRMERGAGVTSWSTYTYEGDLLMRREDSYRGTVTEYSYSEDGRTIVTKDRSGNVTRESRYNAQDKLIYIQSSDSEYISLEDDYGNEIYHYVKDGGAEQELFYDERGRVSEIINHSASGDGHINFTYSSDGLHLDITGNVNGTSTQLAEIDYDNAGHIVREADSFVTTWTYNERGQLVEEERYQGDTFKFRYTWEYDEDGRNSRRIDDNALYSTTHYYLRDERGMVIQAYQEQEDPTNKSIVYTILEYKNTYNDHGDREKVYTYESNAETWEDWDTVTFYFYEYDEIPHNIGQLIP